MIRRYKPIGLVIVALLATTAIFDSTASAAQFHHEAPFEQAGFLMSNAGEGSHNFTAGLVGQLSCNTAMFAGTEYVSSPQATITESPSYSGCTFLGVGNVKVNIEGCIYKFNSPSESGGSFAGSVNVLCPVNKRINFEASGCRIDIGQQTVSSVGYTNLATKPKSVRAVWNGTGITYTASALCPGAAGTHSNGTYTGSSIITAEDEFEIKVGAYVE